MNPCDFIEWDVGNWSVALECWRLLGTQNLAGCEALEIGSHAGGLSLWLALQGARVICTDINGPTETAVRKHRENGVSHMVTYQAIDATDIAYTDRFDVVLFKSVLGGIGVNDNKERQATAIHQMHKALKKGGELFFAENLVASPLHRLFRQGFVKWGSEWRYVSLEEMQEFLAPFSRVEYRTIGFLGAFGRTERQREMLSWLDKHLLDPLVPTTWRYVVAGVATK